MKHRSFLIKPASSLCNLACKYCFYCDIAKNREVYSYGIMNKNTVEALIDSSLNGNVTSITYAFQGGEPTLAGLSFFTYFVSYVNKKKTNQKIQYSLQTNGYILDQEWVSFFKKHDFLIGVSLDGYAENHNKLRSDLQGEPTFKRINESITLLQKYQIPYNILSVLTKQLAAHPKELYAFYKRKRFSYIQLIPCLPTYPNTVDEDLYALTPKEFYTFYDTFFELWLEDFKRGEYISIALFDNLFTIFKNRIPGQCGAVGNCQLQMVVESNGDVYPCDFYSNDRYRLGNIKSNSISELSKSGVVSRFLKEPKRSNKNCGRCKFQKICNGNCKALNVAYYDEEYCGYQQFLEKYYKILYEIAQIL